MKTKRILAFLLCFVMLVASLVIVASAEETSTEGEGSGSAPAPVMTKYGEIPGEYTDTAKYPFVVFKYTGGSLISDGVKGCETMSIAVDAAKSHQSGNKWNAVNEEYTGTIRTSYILMRRNYTTIDGQKQYTGGDQYDNYAQLLGEVLIDLGGFTLTEGKNTDGDGNTASGIFHQVTTKAWETESSGKGVFRTEYNVINGTIEADTKSVFYGNMWNCTYYYKTAGNTLSTVYSKSVDSEGKDVYTPLSAKLMQDANGGYYYVDRTTGQKFDEVYTSTGELIDTSKIFRSTTLNMKNKDFVWNFEDITFKFVEGAQTANLLQSYTGAQAVYTAPPTDAAPYYFNYKDCIFDLTNAPSKSFTLFNAAPGDGAWLKVAISVEDCEIKGTAANFSNLTLYSVETKNGSSVTFVDGSVKLTITGETDITLPTTPYKTTNAAYYWVKTADKEEYTLTKYTCSVEGKTCADSDDADILCDVCFTEIIGGQIIDYDIAKYPFLLIKSNGNITAHETWKSATLAARVSDGSTVLLRRDYSLVPDVDIINLQAGTGNFTVDLNGYSITRVYPGPYVFDNFCDGSTTTNNVKVTVKNGTFYAEAWLICLSGGSTMKNAKQIDFQFDNVNFVFKQNSKYDSLTGWIFTVHDREYNKPLTSNIVFNNCTFDSTDMKESMLNAGATMFNMDVNNRYGIDYVKPTLTFNGGKIIANTFSEANFYQIHPGDEVNFGKGANEKYIQLEMMNGRTPGAHTTLNFYTVDGKPAFFHSYEQGDHVTKVIYSLTNCMDEDNNHVCDACGIVLSLCADVEPHDHKCDVCQSDITHVGNSHVCSCGEVVGSCVDQDSNHVCDTCGVVMSYCSDPDNNNICDVCGYYKYDLGKYGIFWHSENYSAQTHPFFVLSEMNGVYTFEYATTMLYGEQHSKSAIANAIYNVLYERNIYSGGKYVPQGTANNPPADYVTTAIILMRRDYSVGTNEYHSNIAHAQGEIIVDLGGHTLSESSGSTHSMFNATVKGWPDSYDKVYTFPSTYTFKNGSIKVNDHPFATVNTNDTIQGDKSGWYIINSVFNINFEDIVFGLVDGAKASVLVYSNGTVVNSYSGANSHAKVNVSLKDCIFDLETNPPMPAMPITIIDNSTNETGVGSDVDCDVVFENCTLLAKDMSLITVHKTGDKYTSSTIVVNKDDLTLKMPTGTATPLTTNTVVIGTGAICAFKKSTTTDGYDVYTLTPAATIGFKITSNVTLDTNFIYNVYVPAEYVIGITVNGKAVEYSTVIKNGVECCHVAVNLAAGKSLEDIVLKITLNTGNGTSVTASSTLSVFKYSKTVINGSYAASTKTLVKDMLVYASAAHTYFENTTAVASKLSEINTLLGGYFRELPMGEAKQPADDTYFTSVSIHVGEVPSFRFYLAEAYKNNTNAFTFTVDGVKETVKVDTDGEGKYIEIVMPAYKMLSDVIYTVENSSYTASYNIYSYYDYARKSGNANLLAIVKGLMKYAASAKEYFNVNYGQIIFTVPESIRPNDEGKNVSVLFTNPDYYSAVKFTTDNPNVYVENGKIYAKGAFDEETIVTVTATTDHHYATAQVKVCQSFYIENYTGEEGQLLENGKYIKDSNGNDLTNNYVVRGVADLVNIGSGTHGPHIHFSLYSKTRFLFWDSNNNKMFGAGYETATESNVKDTAVGENYDLTSGTYTFEWAVVVENNIAYWYINGELVKTLEATEKFGYFNIGAQYMDTWIYITDVCTKSENADAYNALVAQYK